jgi:hypothetical protein
MVPITSETGEAANGLDFFADERFVRRRFYRVKVSP